MPALRALALLAFACSLSFACSGSGSGATAADAPASPSCRVFLYPDGGSCGHGGSACPLGDGGTGTCLTAAGPCVDTRTDPAHCGGSLGGCLPGGSCVDGACVYPGCAGVPVNAACRTAGGAGVCCDGACKALDLAHDPANCGGCGIVCPSRSACSGGACATPCDFQCPGGAASCGTCPSGDVCGSPESNVFCGGMACRACVRVDCGGKADGEPCRLPDAGFEAAGVCCSGSCVSTTSDPEHCGGCAIACCAGALCSGGECLLGVR